MIYGIDVPTLTRRSFWPRRTRLGSDEERKAKPDYAKVSHATAISLGLMHNRMYRGAVNRCVNLLVHYPEGCAANCAYCGLG
jgi:hypothetical protein